MRAVEAVERDGARTEEPPPLVHTWRHPPHRNPQPGDRALCGTLKVNPWNHDGLAGSTTTCAVCAELRKTL